MCECRDGYALDVNAKSCIVSCGGTFSEASGTFDTPDWPLSYPNLDFRCEWMIDIANLTDIVIDITFDETYGIVGTKPCPTDYIQVLDGIEHDSKELAKTCSSIAPDLVRTSSQRATVIFQARASADQEQSCRIGASISYEYRSIKGNGIVVFLPSPLLFLIFYPKPCIVCQSNFHRCSSMLSS